LPCRPLAAGRSAYIASIFFVLRPQRQPRAGVPVAHRTLYVGGTTGKRTPREAAQDAAELCRLANSFSHLNEIACNSGLTERQERRKQNLQTRIMAVFGGRAGMRGLDPQPL